MSESNAGGFDQELLDDYFAEADEHLLGIRQGLLKLENSVGLPQPDQQVVEELYREFHSFKGISGIVRLGPAEAVAHTTEDFVRLMKSGKLPLTSAGLASLMAAAQKLEQIVAAFHAQKPLPSCDAVLTDLNRQCAADSHVGSTPPQHCDEVKPNNLPVWKFIFSPSHDLNARGITVQSIRESLVKLGEVQKCTPVVAGEGKIRFEFLVATSAAPADVAAWESQGVSVQAYDGEETPPQKPATAPSSVEAEDAHNPFLAPSHFVRVDLKNLDDLMRIAGEMVINRSRLDAQLSHLGVRSDVRVQEITNGLGRSMRELREAVTRVRMVPAAEIFARIPFVVRDLARQSDKKVGVQLEGQETAMDKYLIERLKDPVLHLVRNAFSHGVETPAERVAAGKPEEAQIKLEAISEGNSILIEISDNGRGVNTKVVAERARKLGMAVPETLDDAALLQIICSSGFSTREDVDTTSGRGVGMAIVLSTIRELGGALSLTSEEGRGSRFTMRLPLTLAIMDALIITAAKQTCAVPQNIVREILHVTTEQIQKTNGTEIVSYRSGVLPVVRLASFFHLPSSDAPKNSLLVISSERGSVGLLVENVLGQREIVVRNLRDPLIQVDGILGATELGDGKPILILDGAALTAGVVRPEQPLSAN